jgi:hypothetical protein
MNIILFVGKLTNAQSTAKINQIVNRPVRFLICKGYCHWSPQNNNLFKTLTTTLQHTLTQHKYCNSNTLLRDIMFKCITYFTFEFRFVRYKQLTLMCSGEFSMWLSYKNDIHWQSPHYWHVFIINIIQLSCWSSFHFGELLYTIVWH